MAGCHGFRYRQLALCSPVLSADVAESELGEPGTYAGLVARALAKRWSALRVSAACRQDASRGDPESKYERQELSGTVDAYGNVWVRLEPELWEHLVACRTVVDCEVSDGKHTWRTSCPVGGPELRAAVEKGNVVGVFLVPRWTGARKERQNSEKASYR